MQRYIVAVLALSGVGVALYIHYEVIYSLLLPSVILFWRRAVTRVVTKILLLLLLYPLLPDRWRRWIDDRAAQWKRFCRHTTRRTIARWKYGPCWMRMIIVVLGAVLAGLLAGIMMFVIPVRIQNIPYFGETLQKKVLPWLLHRSALGEIERRAPAVAKRVPIFVRRTVGKAYLWLWWNTAVPLWKSKQTMSSAMERYLEREKRLTQDGDSRN